MSLSVNFYKMHYYRNVIIIFIIYMTSNKVIIQNIINTKIPITSRELKKIVDQVLQFSKIKYELVIRLVDIEEIIMLNKHYRKKNQPTNVISFQFEIPQGVKSNYLGDIVICIPIVIKEAKIQHKNIKKHLCHLLIHGVLHLLGYNHENTEKAKVMEKKEREYLKNLNFKKIILNNK